MKKMILTLAIAVSTLSAFAGDDNVNQKVLDAFTTEFTTAKEVEWSIGSNYYKATFNYNGKYVFAFYNENGEMIGFCRYLSPNDLPLALQYNLKKGYDGYWISDLVEVAKNNDTNYYITLENANKKIVLKSSDNSWSVHNKNNKS